MQEILNLEAEKASLINKLVNPAVVNTRRKVRSTFTPRVALRYKDYFDTAIQLGKSVKICASDFPRINCNTIRQQANDALLYLIHHYHDTAPDIEARYLRFRVMSKFRVVEDGVEILHGFEVKNSGVHREIVVQAMEASGMKAPDAELSKDEAASVLGIAPTNNDDDKAWRMELIDWLNDPKDVTKFTREGVFKPSDLSFISGLCEANDLVNESTTGVLLVERKAYV
jgi:hypothetical protein